MESRLSRERAKFADYDDLKAKASQVDELSAKLGKLETAAEEAKAAKEELKAIKDREKLDATKAEIAKEYGIPAEVLRGGDEKELREHAEALKGTIKLYPETGARKQNGGASGDEKSDFARALFGRE